MSRPRNRCKRVILEELSAFLTIPDGDRITCEFYERMRKYNCWVFSVVRVVAHCSARLNGVAGIIASGCSITGCTVTGKGSPTLSKGKKRVRSGGNFGGRDSGSGQGAEQLVRKLEGMGVEICVYTTSARSVWYIRSLLRFYGIRIVNQAAHERAVGKLTSHGRAPSKIPRLFGIDLHVDDSRGVAIEGGRFNFEVLVVDPGDKQWAERVVEAVEQAIKKKSEQVGDAKRD